MASSRTCAQRGCAVDGVDITADAVLSRRDHGCTFRRGPDRLGHAGNVAIIWQSIVFGLFIDQYLNRSIAWCIY